MFTAAFVHDCQALQVQPFRSGEHGACMPISNGEQYYFINGYLNKDDFAKNL